MAASASLSSAFSLYSPHSFSRSSSRPTNHLSTSQQFIITAKTLSRTAFSSYPVFDSYTKFGNSRNINGVYKNDKRSVSAQQENQPQQAYKEAIVYGDEKIMCEVEDLIFMMEKEKNELAQKVSAMSAEISSGKEKYVRLQADFDNYRKRSEKERLTVRNDAQGEVIESLLPMVDSFERAKEQLKLETEKEKKIDTSYQGIYKQFVEIMRSLRVAAVPTVGKPFDPSAFLCTPSATLCILLTETLSTPMARMHEAIAREESHEFKEGIIIQEFRRGFYLGERLLRPAMVKVSSGPGKKKSLSVPEQSSEQQASVAGVDNR
ncbi:hypothetical protein DH2020_007810 [Rehmannia glutinosa]|uniref:GrpE protein homolog n=1 Tax=Rehmannia glutinosa TaxID=99300 RepID=A0ABR0U026_REHGL